MNCKNSRGQTLVESLGALWLLLLLFFSIYYIFLIGIEKIRSLDTVYHLARIQEVQKSKAGFLAQTPLAIAQCLSRVGLPQVTSLGGNSPPVSEVAFQFVHDFGPTIFQPHKSIMRVAQADLDYLTKSYPNAPDDSGGAGLPAKLIAEALEVKGLAQGNLDTITDAAEDAKAVLEADKP